MHVGATASAQNTTAASLSGTKLAQDFDTFLVLLTTQLQNQDPLEPLDSNEFTAQLVQFTGVEQAIATNKNLESLVSILSAQSENGLFNYLGKEVTAFTDTVNLNDTNQPEWVYDLGANVPGSKLIIENASGVKVAEFVGGRDAGRNTFVWDGNDEFGNRLPNGRYRLRIDAKTGEGTPVNSDVFIRGTVAKIEHTAQGPLLAINGSFIFPNQITTINNPLSTTASTGPQTEETASATTEDNSDVQNTEDNDYKQETGQQGTA